MTPSLRARVHEQLDAAAWRGAGLSPVNKLVIAAILASVLVTIVESEPQIAQSRAWPSRGFEVLFGVLFVLEYAARLWTSVESARYGPGFRGRLRFIKSPAAILDLVALSPFLIGFIGGEVYLLRLFRMIRVLRLARLGEFSSVVSSLVEALKARRYELWMSAILAALLLIMTSTALHLIEGAEQPTSFGSIPRAMWWSIATLTTVGYGDALPLTPLGKVFAGATALTGIGLIAMPTGILASAFSDALQRRRELAAISPTESQATDKNSPPVLPAADHATPAAGESRPTRAHPATTTPVPPPR